MASGKSLEKESTRMVRVFRTDDGSPLRRAVPKVKASKKQRRKAKALLGKLIKESEEEKKANGNA